MPKKKDQEPNEIFIDLDRERELLRYIAIRDFSIALHADARLFAGANHARIFKVLCDLKSHFPVKTISSAIMRHVKGPSSVIDDVANSVELFLSAADLKTYGAAREILELLRDLHAQREIVATTDEAGEHARSGNVKEAFQAIRQLIVVDHARVDTGDYLESFEARKAYMQERGKQSGSHRDLIPTGLDKFDKHVGGLQKGEVGVIIGETGGGKSITKLNFAAHAWLKKRNCIHVGLEMLRQENEFRLDTYLTAIQAHAFRLARLSPADYRIWETIIEALRKQHADNYLEFVSGRGLTMSEILATVESIENRRGKVDLLVLDHITLVRSDDKYADREKHRAMWENMEAMSQWAKDRRVAVWTSGQMDSDGMQKKRKGGVSASNIKYGKGVSEIAQLVAVLYQTDADAISGDMTLDVVKGRNVPKGLKIPLHPDFNLFVLDKLSYYNSGLDVIRQFKKVKSGGKKNG